MNRKLLAVIGIFAMLLGILAGSVLAAAPEQPDNQARDHTHDHAIKTNAK